MPQSDQIQQPRSFLLRIWREERERESNGAALTHTFVLEDIETGQRVDFCKEADLIMHIVTQF